MGVRRKKSLIDQAAEIAEQVLPTIEEAVENAKDKAGPILAEAGALAKEKAVTARDAVEEVVHSESSKKKRRGGKLRKVLLFSGIAAVVGFVVKTVLDRKQSGDNWQSAYEPPAAPARPAAADKPAPEQAALTDDLVEESADELVDVPADGADQAEADAAQADGDAAPDDADVADASADAGDDAKS